MAEITKAAPGLVEASGLEAATTLKNDGKIPPYQNKSLFILGPENPFRKSMIKIAHSSWFEAASIGVILANCIFLMIAEPLDIDPDSSKNQVLENAEHVFNFLFTLEMCIKIIAMSFISGPYAYLKDNWNVMDFIIVTLGLAPYIAPDVLDVSALRTIRVLRPLKTLSTMPGMRIIISALLKSVPKLLNVGALLLFTFVILGIVGVQFYAGVMDGTCFIADPTNSTHAIIPAEHNYATINPPNVDPFDAEGYCMMYEDVMWPKNMVTNHEVLVKKENGGRLCTPININGTVVQRYCGRIYEKRDMIDGVGNVKQATGTMISFGTGNFDNIGRAMLSIYTSITLEGWVDIVYALYDAFGLYGITATYFTVMILFGALFMLNLTLAVVEGAMGDAEADVEEEEKAEEAAAEAEAAAHPELAKPAEAERKQGGNPFFRKIVQSDKPNGSTMFENFIIFAILANTLVMALERYDPDSRQTNYDDAATEVLEIMNDVFTWVFVVELIFKLLGLGFREYAADRMNRFDFLITVIPVIEFCMKHANPGESSGSGIGALRSFRLFRLFKLARSWKTLNDLLKSLAQAIAGSINAVLLLMIIMFIFTLLGMQFFGGKMETCQPIHFRPVGKDNTCLTEDNQNKEDNAARGHFDSFWWGLVTVFQVLTGENWNEVLYQAIDGTSWALGALYFILLNVIGNYIIFNIFLSILLNEMEGGDDDEDTAKYENGEGSSAKVMPEGEGEEGDENEKFDRVATQEPPELILGGKAFWLFPVDSPIRMWAFSVIKSKSFDNFILFLIFISSLMLALDQPFLENCEGFEKARQGEQAWKWPDLMVPNQSECDFKSGLDAVDVLITFLFIGECLIKVFALGFVHHQYSYLRNNWNKLDFFIVLISVINLASGGGGEMGALKSLRAMRALRPLRLVSRNPGMKLVVNSILNGLPEIGNVVIVCALFYLILAIIGVQNWKGALNQCNNPDKVCHQNITIDPEHPALTCCTGSWSATGLSSDRDCSACSITKQFPEGLGCFEEYACMEGEKFYVDGDAKPCSMLSDQSAIEKCEELAYCAIYEEVDIMKDALLENATQMPAICKETNKFEKPEFQVLESWGPVGAHFDNVGMALLSVFECSSGEMWPNIMVAVMDSVGQDQPFAFEYNWVFTPFYFIVVQILCAFLLLNLFVGVLVEQYNSMKDGDGVGPLITEQQKMWIETQRLALDCAPERKVVPPQDPTQRTMFSVVESRAFELFIMGCIMLNIVVMMMRYYDQTDGWGDFLTNANYLFVVIFSIEMFLKLYALRFVEYFKRNWNRFDCFIVILSWTALVLRAADINIGSLATLLRVARVARIFRLVQTNENLALLFQTLVLAFPAIWNVFCVTMLFFFIFAVMGMNLFSKVKLGENLSPHANFRSFWGSFMLLFRMSTGESYNGVMHDCRIQEEDGVCSDEVGDCGVPIIAELYFLLFFLVSAMLMLNIIVAIILDNYGDQEEQDQHYEKVGPEDMQVFKQVWAEKDPLAKGYIDCNDVIWIVSHLPEPLGLVTRGEADANEESLTKLARNKLKSLDSVPECNGKVYFHHVLRELVKAVHADVDVSNLVTNPRMSELENKAKHSKLEKRANKQKKFSSNNKQNGEPYSVAESSASLRLQTAWRGKIARKTLPEKNGGSVDDGSVQKIEEPISKASS